MRPGPHQTKPRKVLPLLARHYTVLAVDLPGHGFTDSASGRRHVDRRHGRRPARHLAVRDIDDRVSSPGESPLAKKIFAQGHEPSNRALERDTAYRYQAKQPVQNGDSAKVTVVVKDAKTGQPAGEVQWSATKVGDVWKLTDAPLPAK